MERTKILTEQYALYFLIVIYLVGVFGHLTNELRPIMYALTPFTLLMTAGFVLFFAVKNESDKKLYLYIAGVYLATFVIEMIGVNTGVIFGNYTYGATLGYKLVNTPFIIGINWIIIVFGARALIASIGITQIFLVSALAALLCLVFDIVLEQMAPVLGYWAWQGGSIPLQNYIAWYVISFVLLIVAEKMNLKPFPKIAGFVFVMQFMFFLLLLFIGL